MAWTNWPVSFEDVRAEVGQPINLGEPVGHVAQEYCHVVVGFWRGIAAREPNSTTRSMPIAIPLIEGSTVTLQDRLSGDGPGHTTNFNIYILFTIDTQLAIEVSSS